MTLFLEYLSNQGCIIFGHIDKIIRNLMLPLLTRIIPHKHLAPKTLQHPHQTVIQDKRIKIGIDASISQNFKPVAIGFLDVQFVGHVVRGIDQELGWVGQGLEFQEVFGWDCGAEPDVGYQELQHWVFLICYLLFFVIIKLSSVQVLQLIQEQHNRMKISTQQLSSFQKQQYTLYLETQLQKFSSFMLAQKKDNERNKNLESTIQNMSKNIALLTDRVKMLEFYQKENFRQCEKIQSQTVRAGDFECRLKKVQSLYFQRPVEGRNKENNSHLANVGKGSSNQLKQIEKYIENMSKDTNKKLKNIEKDIQQLYSITENADRAYLNKRQSQPILTNYSQVGSVHNSYSPQGQGVTKGELKVVENKIYDAFELKFSKIEKMIRRSLGDSKSPRPMVKHSHVSSNEQNILIKEQTFGEDYSPNSTNRNFQRSYQAHPQNFQTLNHDHDEIDRTQKSVNQKSYLISDTSQRLKPMNSRNSYEDELKPSMKKKGNKKSKQLTKQKSNTRSVSKSASRSKSKSLKAKENKVKPVHQFDTKKLSLSLSPSPYIEKHKQSKSSKLHKRSQSKSLSPAHSQSRSRSKSIRDSKISSSKSPKGRKNGGKGKIYEGKEYLMNCRKDH